MPPWPILVKTLSLRLFLIALAVLCFCLTERIHAQSADVTIIVRVTDKVSGVPVSNAQVLIPRQTAGAVTGVTDHAGLFERRNTTFVLSNKYSLTVSARDYNSITLELDLAKIQAASSASNKRYEISVQLTQTTSSTAATTSDQTNTHDNGQNGSANTNSGGGGRGPNGNEPADTSTLAGLLKPIGEISDLVIRILGCLFLVTLVLGLIARVRGHRLIHLRPGQRIGSLRESTESLVSNTSTVLKEFKEFRSQQDDIARNVNTLIEHSKAVKDSTVGSKQKLEGIENILRSNPWSPKTSQTASEMPGSDVGYGVMASPSAREIAKSSFLDLAKGNPVSVEPVYLNTEVLSTPAGSLQDKNIYLAPVSNNSGTFVLLPDGAHSGWIFPNPASPFRQLPLRRIFPLLTDEDFDYFRERIEPVRAFLKGDGRWQVELPEDPNP